MALMGDSDRLTGSYDWMRANDEETGNVKTEIQEAYNSADQWLNDNQGSFNLALPSSFRDESTEKQKARLLTMVLNKRFKLGIY